MNDKKEITTFDVVDETKDNETLKIIRSCINNVALSIIGHCCADAENELEDDDEDFINNKEEIYKEARKKIIYQLINLGYSNYSMIWLIYKIQELDIEEQIYKLADLYRKLTKSTSNNEYDEIRKEMFLNERSVNKNYNKKLYSTSIYNDEDKFLNAKSMWWIMKVQIYFDFDTSLYLIEQLLQFDDDEIEIEAPNIIFRLVVWRIYQNNVITEYDVDEVMSRIQECKLTYEIFGDDLVEKWRKKAHKEYSKGGKKQ